MRKLTLPVKIFIALIAGIIVGFICNAAGLADLTTAYLRPFGTIFVNLLKFIVVPAVLLSMIDGIVSMGDIGRVGKIGVKTVVYFLVTTAIACVIGLVIANAFDSAGLFPVLQATGEQWKGSSTVNVMDTLVNIFPSNMWDSFIKANMLQVIVIAILFGGSILAAKEQGAKFRELLSSMYAVIAKMMEFIISLSPIGVFAMMSWVVATQGPNVVGHLAVVLLCAYIAYVIHAVFVYSLSVKLFAGTSPIEFFRKAMPAMIFAFTSTSSVATLPVAEKSADDLGADREISSFVLPLGATVNMDGTAIYQCVATVFLATCCGIHLTVAQMTIIVVTATLASIGTAGTPGAGMIMLAMVLTAMGIDVNMIMIIYGVDRLFDMGRTSLNVTGDISCALCVTKWEKK